MSRRKNLSKQARQIILWLIAFFFVFQLAGGLVIEKFFPRVRHEMLFTHVDCMRALPQAPAVVCVGSSRFGYGLDDAPMTKRLQEATGDATLCVYNAAAPAGELLNDNQTLRRLLDEGLKPRCLLIEINPELLSDRNDWIGFYMTRAMRWREVPQYLSEVTRTGNLLRLVAARCFPLVHHRREVCANIGAALAEKCDLEREEPLPAGNPWPAIARGGVGGHPDATQRTQGGLHGSRRFLRGYQPGGNAGAALHALIQRCRRYGIEPILLMPPVTAEHRALYTPPIEAAFQAALAEFKDRYALRVYDFRSALPQECFWDNHHATPEGAALLSRRIADEVLAPFLRDQKR